MRLGSVAVVTILLTICFPAAAAADNTTVTSAYSLMPGGTAAEAFVSDANPLRWYWFIASAGRSYCAETQGGVHFDTSATAGIIDTVLSVIESDTTTVIISNDDASEPGGGFLSRACWRALSTEVTYIRVGRNISGTAYSVRTRIVETTLFSPWFFVGSDYSAYTVLRNTTRISVSYTINWRNLAGTIVATSDGTLPANGTTFINGASLAPVVVAGSGSVEITYVGSPGAIVANTTVLSPTTGLSFDAPFAMRPTW
jgi:hypothetical protein